MTIRDVGKPVPSQLFLMQLAGLVVSGRMQVKTPSDKQIELSRNEGYRALMRMTGKDFGFDVERWYNYLIVGDYGLTHTYGYNYLRRFLQSIGYNAPFKKDVISKIKTEPLAAPVAASPRRRA